jgi:hypothetical protein
MEFAPSMTNTFRLLINQNNVVLYVVFGVTFRLPLLVNLNLTTSLVDGDAAAGLLLGFDDKRVELLGRVSDDLLQVANKFVHKAFTLDLAATNKTKICQISIITITIFPIVR